MEEKNVSGYFLRNTDFLENNSDKESYTDNTLDFSTDTNAPVENSAITGPEIDILFTTLNIRRDIYWFQVYLMKFIIYINDRCSDNLRSHVIYHIEKSNLLWIYDEIFITRDVPAKKCSVIDVTSEMMQCDICLYKEHKMNTCLSMLQTVIKVSKKEINYHIGILLYHMLSDSTAISSSDTLWYCNNGVWGNYSTDSFLWNYIDNELMDFLTHNGAFDLVIHMKVITNRTNVLKDLKLRLMVDNIEEILDSKNNLICFENGVLCTKSMNIRQAVPGDYLSIKTGINLEIDMDKKSKTRLLEILSTVFPKKTLLDFFLNSCSTFLEGYNHNKIFYIWWGKGNNAKTLIQRLVLAALGDYCNTAPTSLITGKRTGSSNATPDLCHIDKRLVVFLQEPNHDEKMKTGVIKEMTGNDRIYIRQLFKAPKSITLKAKIVLVCNNILEIPGIDSALQRRIIVVPFISTFLSKKEHDLRTEKGTISNYSHIIDQSIENELVSYKGLFMRILYERYLRLKESDLKLDIPPIIDEFTDEYLTKHNYSLFFIRFFIINSNNDQYSAKPHVYECFKDWFRKSYPGKKVVNLEEFSSVLQNEGYIEDEFGILKNGFCTYVLTTV